jgi:hypothetical protein
MGRKKYDDDWSLSRFPDPAAAAAAGRVWLPEQWRKRARKRWCSLYDKCETVKHLNLR